MGVFRRDGRIRPGTLWIVFVVALLAGAAAGWSYRWWTHRTLLERAHQAVEEMKSKAEKITK